MFNCTKLDNYDTRLKNGSQCLTSVEEYHQYLFGTTLSKLGFCFSHFTVSVIGTLMLVGIVLYENFGGDRQKRNILNQLLSGFMMTFFVPNTMYSICKIWFDLFGFVDEQIMCFLIGFSYFCFTYGFGCLNQLTIIRFYYIVVWKRMKVINDQFWFQFLTASNLVVAFITSVYIVVTSKSLIHSSLNAFPRLVQTTKIEDAPDSHYRRYSILASLHNTIAERNHL